MAYEMDAPIETEQHDSPQLKVAGKFHCSVLFIEDEPRMPNGTLYEDVVFMARCVVLDGTIPGQQGKQLNMLFRVPKLTHKDNGEMCRKKILFFTQSIGCVSVANGKMVIKFGPEVGEQDYNEGDEYINSLYARGRQFVVETELGKNKDDSIKEYAEMRYANVWHVDNPVVKDVPKDKAMLAALPPDLRKTPKDFAKAGKPNDPPAANASGKTETSPQKPAPMAAKPPVDVGDL